MFIENIEYSSLKLTEKESASFVKGVDPIRNGILDDLSQDFKRGGSTSRSTSRGEMSLKSNLNR